MITREEALQMTHNCRITSLGELAHGYVIYQVAAKGIINQLFDQQDQLEQHIKSLEAQLANTERLTCETCSYFSRDGRSIGLCHNISPQCPRYTLTNFGCILHSKDTE